MPKIYTNFVKDMFRWQREIMQSIWHTLLLLYLQIRHFSNPFHSSSTILVDVNR